MSLALSLDDTFERMQIFAQVLKRFQESLEHSMAQLKANHEVIDGLWQDERRARYDAEYSPLLENLQRYVDVQGPEYLQFLEQKIQAIDQYLHG